MRRAAVLALLGVAAACNGGVHDLADEPVVFGTLHVRLDAPLAALVATSSGSFRVGILWAGSPVFVPYCFEHGPNPLDPNRPPNAVADLGCRDPQAVVAGMPGQSVPIERTSDTWEVPLTDLPSTEVMVGDVGARVAYGSVIVFLDDDNSGTFDIVRGCENRAPGEIRRRDRILASSFVSIDRPQRRIAYVEGTFDRGSYFYPNPQCRALPALGYSIWNVDLFFGPTGGCSRDDIGAEIVLGLDDPRELNLLGCRIRARESFPRSPPERAPAVTDTSTCTKDGALAVYSPTCGCPRVRVYTLSGCDDSLECTKLDWDVRDNPPDWWRCGR